MGVTVETWPWRASTLNCPHGEVVAMPTLGFVVVAVAKIIVPVAVKLERLVSPEMFAVPVTPKVVPGVAVPTPKFPKSAVYDKAEIPPPVKVNPPEDERPATTSPPEKVEVAVPVTRREPSVTARPPDERSERTESPPDQVEVAVEVFKIDPPETVRPPVRPREEDVTPPVKLEVAAPVTAIKGVMTEEVAIKPEAEVVPVTETVPETANVVPGVVVPTPTLPEVFSITNVPALTFNPPAKVEVAAFCTVRWVTVVVPKVAGTVFAKSPPPVIFKPATFKPPLKVEVAVLVMRRLPPEMAIPLVAWRVEVMSPV